MPKIIVASSILGCEYTRFRWRVENADPKSLAPCWSASIYMLPAITGPLPPTPFISDGFAAGTCADIVSSTPRSHSQPPRSGFQRAASREPANLPGNYARR